MTYSHRIALFLFLLLLFSPILESAPQAFRRDPGHPQWHHSAFQEVKDNVRTDVRHMLHSRAELKPCYETSLMQLVEVAQDSVIQFCLIVVVNPAFTLVRKHVVLTDSMITMECSITIFHDVPFQVPLEVNVVLVGFSGDGGYRYELDAHKFEEFLKTSFPSRRPACLETGELLDIEHHIIYNIFPMFLFLGQTFEVPCTFPSHSFPDFYWVEGASLLSSVGLIQWQTLQPNRMLQEIIFALASNESIVGVIQLGTMKY
ncbi:hypothetical protein ACLOJK_026559 [Asimina triloba]